MPNIDIVRTQLFPRKSIDNRRFTVVFQSLTCPAITGAEDGTFNLEDGTDECVRLNRFYDGKVNHWLVPADQLKRPHNGSVAASPVVTPSGNSQLLDEASSRVSGGSHE